MGCPTSLLYNLRLINVGERLGKLAFTPIPAPKWGKVNTHTHTHTQEEVSPLSETHRGRKSHPRTYRDGPPATAQSFFQTVGHSACSFSTPTDLRAARGIHQAKPDRPRGGGRRLGEARGQPPSRGPCRRACRTPPRAAPPLSQDTTCRTTPALLRAGPHVQRQVPDPGPSVPGTRG